MTHWKSPEEWNRLKTGADCPMCADIHLDVNPFSFKVAELEHTYVRLPRNQYQRRWTIVAPKRHASELNMNEQEVLLSEPEYARSIRDLQHAMAHG